MSEDERCENCGAVVRTIYYGLGPMLMHVDPDASWASERRGTAWRYCRLKFATLAPTRSSQDAADDAGRPT